VRASDDLVRLRNGSEIRFRSLDDPSKLLSTTYGGVLIDQAEELDGGPEGEHLLDILRSRLSDPRGRRKLLLVANRGPMTHWLRRRFVDERTRDSGVRVVHFRLSDNAANLPADYVEAMEATRASRPHWHRTFVEGVWGAFEGAAYESFDARLHVVAPF